MTASVFANLKSGGNLQLLQHFILMNKDERNFLKVLAELGDVERVNKLIDFGADVNASSTLDGSTALIGAARGNYTEVVSILLNNGANVKHVDMFGLTALDWAEACGCEETAALLRLASGCPLWSTSMVTELLKGTTSSTSDTMERDVTWMGSLLAQRGVSPDHIAWCETVLIEQEGFCTSEVFASVPESVLSRAYLSSVGICALGVQQVLLQLHAELKRGLSERASCSSYTVSESTSEAHSSDTTSSLEEEQFISDDGAENETSASNDSSGSSSSSCTSKNDSEDDSSSSGSDSISNSNNDDSTNSDSGDPLSFTSFYKTHCASAQYSNTSDTSNNTNNAGSRGLVERCATKTSVNDGDSTSSVTSTHATTIPTATTVSSTSTTSATPPTNNSVTESGTDDPVTSSRCSCLCFFCPAGRQVALRTVHTILAKYHVVILLCLASASVGLVVGYNCTAQGMLKMILLLWFFLMVMAAVAADAYDEETE